MRARTVKTVKTFKNKPVLILKIKYHNYSLPVIRLAKSEEGAMNRTQALKQKPFDEQQW